MARKNMNPHNLTVGSEVILAPRADGVEHREGNDAVWEIMSIHEGTGTVMLHLAGAGPEATCGAHLSSLTPAN